MSVLARIVKGCVFSQHRSIGETRQKIFPIYLERLVKENLEDLSSLLLACLLTCHEIRIFDFSLAVSLKGNPFAGTIAR